MSKFITVSMLTINTDHIIYVRELALGYVVVVSSFEADFRRPESERPFEFEAIKNDSFHFTKGRPETVALEKWLKEQSS